MKRIVYIFLATLIAVSAATACGANPANTGYDGVQNIALNEEGSAFENEAGTSDGFAETDDEKKENSYADVQIITKEDIWHKMLNSIDYYSKASGTVMYAGDDVEEAMLVDFMVDIDAREYYANTTDVSVDVDGNDQKLSMYSDSSTPFSIVKRLSEKETYATASEVIILNTNNSTYVVRPGAVLTRANTGTISDDERVEIDDNGMYHYRYRANPICASIAGTSLFPQEMALGYLRDFSSWDIKEHSEYQGRNCVVVTGKTDEEYQSKLNVSDFVFYVDSQTGILLKYLGYNFDGQIADYIIIDNLVVDSDDISVKLLDKASLANYTDETVR